MKKIFFLLVFIFGSLSMKAQDATAVLNALKAGNAEMVSSHFDKILDLKFPDKDEIKSIGKNQAGIALKSFFDKNAIKGFELASQREMGGTTYIAGRIINGEEGYKISIMMRNREGKPQIVSVRIN